MHAAAATVVAISHLERLQCRWVHWQATGRRRDFAEEAGSLIWAAIERTAVMCDQGAEPSADELHAYLLRPQGDVFIDMRRALAGHLLGLRAGSILSVADIQQAVATHITTALRAV